MPGAMGDPLAVIQNFAGVARAAAGSGDIIVRGSAPQDTQFFVDGTAVPINLSLWRHSQRLAGGHDRQSGVLSGQLFPLLQPGHRRHRRRLNQKAQAKKPGGYVDVSLLDSGIYVEAPIGDKAAVAAAVRRSYIDWLLNSAIPSNAPITDITCLATMTTSSWPTIAPAPAHDLRLFVFGSDDTFRIVFRNAGQAGTEGRRQSGRVLHHFLSRARHLSLCSE